MLLPRMVRLLQTRQGQWIGRNRRVGPHEIAVHFEKVSRAFVTEHPADWRAGCGRFTRPVRWRERVASPVVPTSTP